MDTDNWELQTLPELSDKPTSNSTYFSCVYHVRNNLTKLNLARGMIGRQDFDRLAEFRRLLELEVDYSVLTNLYDCNNLLKYLPQLKVLKVGGFKQADNYLDAEEGTHQISTRNNTLHYNHIAELSLDSYHPTTDDELLHIINNYTELNHLTMEGMSGISWLVTTIRSPVIPSFMELVQKCNYYSIVFGGASGETWLLTKFYNSLARVGDLGTDFTITHTVWSQRSYIKTEGEFE